MSAEIYVAVSAHADVTELPVMMTVGDVRHWLAEYDKHVIDVTDEAAIVVTLAQRGEQEIAPAGKRWNIRSIGAEARQ